LKICIICTGFAYIFGGVETVVYKLSEQWAKQGHRVYILSGLGKKSAPSNVKLIKLPFIPSKYFQKIPLIKKIFPASEFEALSLLPFVLLCLIGINPDIVLSNQLAETLPARILRIPLVMISQAPIRMRFNAFKKAEKVIVNDPQSYKALKMCGIDAEFIPNGVDKPIILEKDMEELRAKYKIPDKSIVILTVARLDSNKRISLLIDAFMLIKEDATLIIVGEGPELPSLKKQASSIKSRNKKIIFLKPMPHNQLKELYQLCDVFTLPSKLEAFGLVLLEALALGKPAVTSHDPRRKFILGNFGVYTNVENPSEYSRSLLHAVSNKIDVTSPEYLQHMQKFDWKQIAQHYIKVFNNVLKKASSKHK
jgi:glycosyltransferase involved in cell wall biosynthesis